MERRCLLFDLDTTLYPGETGFLAQLDGRIEEFVAGTLGIEVPAARALRLDYRQRYGTTLRGLMENHGRDPQAYIRYVYDVDPKRFLRPDPALSAMLDRLPWPKAVFSNSPAAQVGRVLEALGLQGRFARIFGLEFSRFRGKPDPLVYRMVLAALALPGEACVMIDDSAANLAPAGALGMATVLLGREEAPWVDLRLGSLLELEEALPCLRKAGTGGMIRNAHRPGGGEVRPRDGAVRRSGEAGEDPVHLSGGTPEGNTRFESPDCDLLGR